MKCQALFNEERNTDLYNVIGYKFKQPFKKIIN